MMAVDPQLACMLTLLLLFWQFYQAVAAPSIRRTGPGSCQAHFAMIVGSINDAAMLGRVGLNAIEQLRPDSSNPFNNQKRATMNDDERRRIQMPLGVFFGKGILRDEGRLGEVKRMAVDKLFYFSRNSVPRYDDSC